MGGPGELVSAISIPGLRVVSRTGVLLHEKDKEKTRPLPGKHASGYGGSRDFVLNTSGISGLQQRTKFQAVPRTVLPFRQERDSLLFFGAFLFQTAE